MSIRIDLSQDQDVEVTATFEVCDEVPDCVTAEDAEDILELMDSSNISMEDVLTEAIKCGVALPDSYSLTIDMVLAFIDGGSVDALGLRRVINAAVMQMSEAIDRAEGANKTLREELDRLAAADQKTA